jgi:hypothetical protein
MRLPPSSLSMHERRWRVGLCMAALSWGCGSPPVDGVGALEAAIIGGEPSTADHDGVVLIVRGQFIQYCTGTVVAPHLILTARHCLFESLVGEGTFIGCDSQGNGPAVIRARDAEDFAVYVGNAKPFFEPDAQGVGIHSSGELDLCRNDIALLEVEPALEPRPLPLRLDEGPVLDEVGTLVGWGAQGLEGPSLPDARHEREVIVSALGPTVYPPKGGVPRLVVEAAFVGTEGGCGGDSGGPLLAKSGAVFGVQHAVYSADPELVLDEKNSRLRCLGAATIFQRIDHQREWLRETFRSLGAAPWSEGKAAPGNVGDRCVDSDECISGACVTAGTQSFCSLDCSNQACPDGMECVGPELERVCTPLDIASAEAPPQQCGLSPPAQPRPWLWFVLVVGALRRRCRPAAIRSGVRSGRGVSVARREAGGRNS